jgi:hypothetical protein
MLEDASARDASPTLEGLIAFALDARVKMASPNDADAVARVVLERARASGRCPANGWLDLEQKLEARATSSTALREVRQRVLQGLSEGGRPSLRDLVDLVEIHLQDHQPAESLTLVVAELEAELSRNGDTKTVDALRVADDLGRLLRPPGREPLRRTLYYYRQGTLPDRPERTLAVAYVDALSRKPPGKKLIVSHGFEVLARSGCPEVASLARTVSEVAEKVADGHRVRLHALRALAKPASAGVGVELASVVRAAGAVPLDPLFADFAALYRARGRAQEADRLLSAWKLSNQPAFSPVMRSVLLEAAFKLDPATLARARSPSARLGRAALAQRMEPEESRSLGIFLLARAEEDARDQTTRVLATAFKTIAEGVEASDVPMPTGPGAHAASIAARLVRELDNGAGDQPGTVAGLALTVLDSIRSAGAGARAGASFLEAMRQLAPLAGYGSFIPHLLEQLRTQVAACATDEERKKTLRAGFESLHTFKGEMARMVMAVDSPMPGHIERQEQYVIIGGIRVPVKA